jgi:hypothetical protein
VSQLDPMRVPDGAQLSGAAREQAWTEFLNPQSPRANVVGFGFGAKWSNGQPTGQAAMVVFVTQKLPAATLRDRDLIPPQLDDGTLTDVLTVGHPIAQQLLTRRMRPCPAGFSIGNVAITAGTLSGVVYDLLPDAAIDPPGPGIGVPREFYVLSNNHVLAASNAAAIGSAIVQPGTFDGGVDPQDRIAILSRFVPIQFSPAVPLDQQQNFVDCAIGACALQDATREIYFNGAPRGWRRAANVQVGDLVRKTGRTTGTTFGRVVAIDATVDVNYGVGVARFQRQILTTNMSAGGDSGSLVTTLDNVAVGLLFAGSAQVTILNYFETVRAMLRVEIAEQLL